jgi:hypothetical protein
MAGSKLNLGTSGLGQAFDGQAIDGPADGGIDC